MSDPTAPLKQPAPEERQEIARVSALLNAAPGGKVENELWALSLSARTFAANAVHLDTVARSFENTLFNPLLVPGRRRDLWEHSFEIVRLFQNAIASGESFLAHCKTSVNRRYKRHPFQAEFQQEFRSRIQESPVCAFVACVRGYLLHKESISPVWSRQLTDFSDPYDSVSSIDLATEPIRAERQEWKRRSQFKAIEYLDRQRDTIKIRRLVDQYRVAVEEFGNWLLTRERAINAEILRESRDLHEQLIAFVDPITAEENLVFRERVDWESWFPARTEQP